MRKDIKKPSLQRLLDLQEFLILYQNVDRVIFIKHGKKQVNENDMEHSYSLALIAWFLAQYFPELDKDLVIRLALTHDIVETYAGDTYIFASSEELSTKNQREYEAALRIKKEWPDFSDMNQAIEEYEARKTPEAKFVYALDKIQPILVIFLNNGYTWQVENISLQELHEQKIGKVAISKDIKPYYDKLYELLLSNKHLFPK